MTRTENDSGVARRFARPGWDLASGVGVTATAVAASRALASQGPDALLADRFADRLVRAVGIQRFVDLLDGRLPEREPGTRAAMR